MEEDKELQEEVPPETKHELQQEVPAKMNDRIQEKHKQDRQQVRTEMKDKIQEQKQHQQHRIALEAGMLSSLFMFMEFRTRYMRKTNEKDDKIREEQEQRQGVTLEINDEAQEQQEEGQQVPRGINNEQREQRQGVPMKINDEVQEQQEQGQQVPPETKQKEQGQRQGVLWEISDEVQEQKEQGQQVRPEINDEQQEQRQEVPLEINDEAQGQQEQGHLVPLEINDEQQEQRQGVCMKINDAIQGQQEQGQQVPQETNDEQQKQRQGSFQEINDEIQDQQEQRQQVPSESNDEIQEQQEEEEQDQFPPKSVFCQLNKTEHHIGEIIGTSDHDATKVYKAACILKDPKRKQHYFSSLKLVKAVQGSESYNTLLKRLKRSYLLPIHKYPNMNILGVTSFIDKEILCVAFHPMDGSIRSLIHSKYPKGMDQKYVIEVLKQSLEGLHFLHQNGQLHGEISAGQMFCKGTRIGLSFAATVYDHGTDGDDHPGFLPNKYMFAWASAPEVHDLEDKRFTDPAKLDIWMIGITALELAYGEVEIRDRGHLMSILSKIKHEQKLLPLRDDPGPLSGKLVQAFRDRFGKKKNPFEKFVLRCLATDPAERPTARELLDSELFETMEVDLYAFHDYLKMPPTVTENDE